MRWTIFRPPQRKAYRQTASERTSRRAKRVPSRRGALRQTRPNKSRSTSTRRKRRKEFPQAAHSRLQYSRERRPVKDFSQAGRSARRAPTYRTALMTGLRGTCRPCQGRAEVRRGRPGFPIHGKSLLVAFFARARRMRACRASGAPRKTARPAAPPRAPGKAAA